MFDKTKNMYTYIAPSFQATSFHCPYCNVLANQSWYSPVINSGVYDPLDDFMVSVCAHCFQISYWHRGNLEIPSKSNVPVPNPDLPQDIKEDYLEASSILNKSSRGAAAILRLTIQKLCKHLGESGDNINNDIASLVKKGLPEKVQQALDIVRVVGNNAVHPGVIEVKDNCELATSLFGLINVIADYMITQPKNIDNMFNSLPENLINGIKKRDGV